MVCRKFQYQCFNYVDEKGKGTLSPVDAVECTPATAFVVSDHLAQLLVTDAFPREGMIHALHVIVECATLSVFAAITALHASLSGCMEKLPDT